MKNIFTRVRIKIIDILISSMRNKTVNGSSYPSRRVKACLLTSRLLIPVIFIMLSGTHFSRFNLLWFKSARANSPFIAPAEKNAPAAASAAASTPAEGYMQAHRDNDNPFGLLGGGISINISQAEENVIVFLPDNRRLDPVIFGTPQHPRAFQGMPVLTGVPVRSRNRGKGRFTSFKEKSPFGDIHITMTHGSLDLEAADITATDAAVTEDKVSMSASWRDGSGNVYSVECDEVLAHGTEYPTFGGVVTNHIIHGFTGIGTPLLPSAFAYFAFWGKGTVKKNWLKPDTDCLIHGILTESIRIDEYKLAFDYQVTPTCRQFHLLVFPYKINGKILSFKPGPVKTGFIIGGKEIRFWHVLFEKLNINVNRM